MDLDVRVLRYFVAVAEELSFSRAAKRLHLSQPPLSYAIKQLEERLEAQLFLRSSRHVALTPAGRALYKEAQFLLRRHTDVCDLVSRIDAGLQGQIKIGFVGSMLYRNLPTVLKQCKEKYPDVEHILLELNSAEQIELVERGGIDIGFIHANPVPETVSCEELIVEPFSICLPASHRLAHKSRVELAELADEDFIFFSRSFSPIYYETLFAMCLDAGFMPSVKYEARHWLSVASLVSQEMGVSIVPQCLARSGLSNIRFLPFKHKQRSIASLIWSNTHLSGTKDNHLSLIMQAYR